MKTTAEKISVMQAYEEGKPIQVKGKMAILKAVEE